MKLKSLLVLTGALIVSSAAHAGDAKRGEELSATCAACHAADGNSTVETNPILAGQYESYLVQALKSYRNGTRKNAIMSGFATALSDQDIADLAAWFASQTPALATAEAHK